MIRFSAQVASVAIALCSANVLAAEVPDVPPAAPLYAVTPPRDFADVKLATSGKISGQSVAVNPKNANVFVAAYANQGSCWVRTSTNAGQTWAAARKLPMPPGKPNCNVPALKWAPDGSRVYAAYSYRITGNETGWIYTKEAGALVSSSTDKGLTWSSPRIVKSYTDEYDTIVSFKMATPLTAVDARWLYLQIEGFTFNAEWYDFARSYTFGQTWSASQRLISTAYPFTYADSPAVAGGPGGEVLLAWGFTYDIGTFPQQFAHEVRTIRSSDHGAAFASDVIAVPNAFGTTAAAFGAGGTAHIIYTTSWGPSPPGTYYVYSTKAPYDKWSTPVALNDDSSARYYYSPSLAISACGTNASVLHAAWIDDRTGSGKYNVYYTRKVANAGWAPNVNLKVSGTFLPPTYDPYYGDGLTAGIAAGTGTAVGLWGQSWDYFDPRPVSASRIAPGVSCP